MIRASQIIERVRRAMRNQPCCSEVVETDNDVAGWPEELSTENLLERVFKATTAIQSVIKAQYQRSAIVDYNGAFPLLNQTDGEIIRPLLNRVFIGSVRAINIPVQTYQTLEASGRTGSSATPVVAYGSGRLYSAPSGTDPDVKVVVSQERIDISDYNAGNDELVLSFALTQALTQYVLSDVYKSLNIPARSEIHHALYIDEVTPYLSVGSNVTVERRT